MNSAVTDLLDRSWAACQSATLYKRWASANPLEAQALTAYWEKGGTPPAIKTSFGLHLLLEAQARHLDDVVAPVISPFTQTRTINVSTASALAVALLDLRAGDLVRASGVFPGQVEIRKNLSATDVLAVVDLSAAQITGGAAAAVGLFLVGAGGIRVVGGEYTNPGGDGIRVENCPGPIEIVDPHVHNTGSQGILVQGNGGPNVSVRLIRPDVHACGDITKDVHVQKGTGLHCIYFGGSTYPSSGEISDAHCHDQEYGCGIEVGANAVKLMVACPIIERMNGAKYGSAGGNAFNVWGPGNRGVLIDSPSGVDITGNVCLTDSLSSPAGAVVVQHGSFLRVGRSPAYMPASGISYLDCVVG